MKRSGSMIIALAALLTALPATAKGPAERGKELFNSARLGSNGKSCASCHANGAKLEGTASYDDGELIKVINQCIKETLAGKPPAADSADMKALVAYIRALVPR